MRRRLRDSDADIVYLSLPNAMHEQWVMAALAAGKHVIVDKPAMMTLEASLRAVEEARRAGVSLAEATVFWLSSACSQRWREFCGTTDR